MSRRTASRAHVRARRARVTAPALAAVASALPPHRISQAEARALVGEMFAGSLGPRGRLLEVFTNAGIEHRYTCMPLDWYRTRHDFAETSACYVAEGLALATRAAAAAIEAAGIAAGEVDHIVFVSSTGIAAPSLDARLVGTLGLRGDVRRTPVWGLGCAGGVAGLARARDFALADPGARVLVVALELCSLSFQPGDRDTRNIIAASLFSDGAAAAVVEGAALAPAAPGRLAIVDAGSTLWPDTLDIMGWTVDAEGLHVVFSRDIPTFVRAHVRQAADAFFDARGLALDALEHVIAHPGGPKVLAALADTLGIPESALAHSREVLREVGNMSSPTVLFALERALAAGDIGTGERALLTALGPGFALEMLLLRRDSEPAAPTARGAHRRA